MSDQSKIIEINGVKFEVDARTATIRQLSTIRIGARVKVLKDDNVYYGTVIGFEPFPENPVVIICYISGGSYYSPAELKFLYYSAKSKEQVVVSNEEDMAGLERDQVVQSLDKEIAKREREITEYQERKAYFLKNFQSYWNAFVVEEPA